MKQTDMADMANRLLEENNRANWLVFFSKKIENKIAWKYKHKMLFINKDKFRDSLSPDTFKNEILKEIADMLSFEMRGFHGRDDNHWKIIAKFYDVKISKTRKEGKRKVKEIPDDFI